MINRSWESGYSGRTSPNITKALRARRDTFAGRSSPLPVILPAAKVVIISESAMAFGENFRYLDSV